MFVNSDVSHLSFVSAEYRKHFMSHILRWLFTVKPRCSSESQPSDKGGGGHTDPEIRGAGRCQENLFWSFGSQFGLKMRGSLGPRAPPLDPPPRRKLWYANEFQPIRGAYEFLLWQAPPIDRNHTGAILGLIWNPPAEMIPSMCWIGLSMGLFWLISFLLLLFYSVYSNPYDNLNISFWKFT